MQRGMQQTQAQLALVANEKKFAQESWAEGLRADRRAFNQVRPFSIEFPFAARGSCFVKLGETAVGASVACDLVDPNDYAPKNGLLEFNASVALGFDGATAMRSAAGRTSDTVLIARTLESLLKTGRALDTESLCVLPGRKVWSLRVDVTVYNDEGNAMDAAMWAAIAALRHFRRSEITVSGDVVTVHSPHDRDPIPLALHHIPIAITSVVTPYNTVVIDPTLAEMAASSSAVTVAVSLEGQVCNLRKLGGSPVSYEIVKECIGNAQALASQISSVMDAAMAEDEAKRKAASMAQFTWAKIRKGVAAKPQEGTPDEAPASKKSKPETEEALVGA